MSSEKQTNKSRRRVSQSRWRRLYQYNVGRRAALAARLVSHHGWSVRDAAGMLSVNRTYLWLARHLNDDDREKLANGEITLAGLHRQHQQRQAEQRAAERSTSGLSDSAVDNIVREVGVDRVWRAIDRLTQPSQSLVAA
jgi:hypothetical protein